MSTCVPGDSVQRCRSSSGLLLAVSLSLLIAVADASCPAPDIIRPPANAHSANTHSANTHSIGACALDAPLPAHESDAAATESSVYKTLDHVPWADARDWVHNPPQLLQELRNYKRQGMPILHLVNTSQTVVALGVSNHGKPGLYFTRQLPF